MKLDLIKQLQETVLFEEDLFPSAPREDVVNRKIEGLKKRHEEEIGRSRKYFEEEQQKLRSLEQQKQELAPKIEQIRVEIERRNRAWVEKRKSIGIVGNPTYFKIPDAWAVDIREYIYKLSPDFYNLPVEVTGEVITFAGKGIQIILVCDVEAVFKLPFREDVDLDSSHHISFLRGKSIEEFVDETNRFRGDNNFFVEFTGILKCSTLTPGDERSKEAKAYLFYYPLKHTVSNSDLLEDYRDLKKRVARGPLKREQISLFRDIRTAAVERDYKTIQDLVAKLGQYYGQ